MMRFEGRFVPAQGDFVARSVGMPDVPRVMLPHPVAATGADNLRRVAELIRDEVIARLSGRPAPPREGPDAR